MSSIIAFLYGLAAYSAFFASFLYAIGFVSGLGVPKGIDSGAVVPVVPLVPVGALDRGALDRGALDRGAQVVGAAQRPITIVSLCVNTRPATRGSGALTQAHPRSYTRMVPRMGVPEQKAGKESGLPDFVCIVSSRTPLIGWLLREWVYEQPPDTVTLPPSPRHRS